jgi:Ca-activated chloride channel family protein
MKTAVHIPMVEMPLPRSRGLGSILGPDKAPLPLASVQLRARVIDRVAEVDVEEKFANTLSEAMEAVYIFPLAGGSAVSKFEMQVGARVLRGRVEERAEARKQYQEALEQGKRAALLEQERDDVFTVQVGNIAPGEEITVRLTYSERLPFFEDGRTELRLPLVVAPRYIGGEELPREQAGHGVERDSSTVPDASRIAPPRLAPGFDPRVALGIEVELFGSVDELACSQHAVRSSSGPESARVQLSREREPLDRDFVLRWKLAAEKVKPALLVHGEYAMLSLLAPARDGYLGTPRDVVFVVDRSGSMEGSKIVSAARACSLLLRTLGPRDRFAVQAFDDVVEWMPGGFAPADEGGIERGEKWLRDVFARGGTELDAAVREALAEIRKLASTESRVPVVVLLTDGQVGDESSALKRLQGELGDARIFTVGIDTAVNDGFLKRLAALGGGTSTLVEPGARLEDALQSVGREIGTPLITGLKISGEVGEAAPSRLPDLFAGRATSIFFRGRGPVTVTGHWADGARYQETIEPREAPLAAIDHLWARARIMHLEDEFRVSHAEKIKKQIVALSMQHTLLTRFTAFVVIDESEAGNKSGLRRTVVQPVEMPAEWEGTAMVAGGVGHLMHMTPGGGPAGAPPPVRAQAKMMHTGRPAKGVLSRIGDLLSGATPETMISREPPVRIDAVRDALEALVKAFAQAHAELKAGRLPPSAPLKEARMRMMEALNLALEVAAMLSPLQRFLRSAAVDLIAALSAEGATAPSVDPLFEKHAHELELARDQARAVLTGGKPPAGSFWEASI